MRVLFILISLMLCMWSSAAQADDVPWWLRFSHQQTERIVLREVVRPLARPDRVSTAHIPVPVASPRQDVPLANFAPIGSVASEPAGHFNYCKRNPRDCPTSTSPKVVVLTQKVWEMLVAVNGHVNRTVHQLTDEEIYGKDRSEYWTVAKTRGDCEDIVLLKRQLLQKQGFPMSAMPITVVDDAPADHAVLMVRTDLGDFVLDNLVRKVMLWNKTKYTFLKRQSNDSMRHWVEIVSPDRNVPTASLRHSQFNYRDR